MTHSLRNRRSSSNRTRLLVGCGSAAVALALVFAPQRAAAQGILANGTIVSGSAEIVTVDTTTTQVDVFSPTVVIDWAPVQDSNGNALDFLRTGATGIFQASQLQNFAVLNRILPSSNGNVAVIDGRVISQFRDVSGNFTPGGFIAFYSPTGILVGSNATFDVGSLLLTTLDTSPSNFESFTSGGTLNLSAQTGSTARIQINSGARITATQENSFFAVVAADVQMLGTARVNGSHAYIAGEVVNLNFSNGLFDISIPVGTAAGGTVVELGGTVGGPSSTGAGDNHILYAVARASADPISMIFRGNLGFDPAQSAGIVNGEIILSANYNVSGRFVDGGSIADGANATFSNNSELSTTRADIFLEDFTATSSLLAISTHLTQVTARNAASSVTGNLLMVGGERAELTASNNQNFTITGDVLVDARDYGVVSSSLQSLDMANAQGGTAFIDAFGGGTIIINGNALVTSDAFAGADTGSGIGGSARGGQALIGSTGGSLTITGNATISARGLGTMIGTVNTGAEARGGLAQFFATQGGQVSVGQNLDVVADAVAANGDTGSLSTVSDAYGGQALFTIFGGGTLNVVGNVRLDANAFAGGSNASTGGALADAGHAEISVDTDDVITIGGDLALNADAFGGDNGGGRGGLALGGAARALTTNGGRISVAGEFTAFAHGLGGDGISGGDGFGGIAGANAITGRIEIEGSGLASTDGFGGNAAFGFGGNGGLGRGGNSFFQANGTLTQSATVAITGNAGVFSRGVGGNGGFGDGQGIAAGRGGDGFGGEITTPNQADPNFGGGAYLLAGADNGILSVGGEANVVAFGDGGLGGFGTSTTDGGRGGDGFGGLAQVGLALLGLDGSVGLGSASFGILTVESSGSGGNGGLSSDFITGDGGNGTGGNSLLTVRAGDVSADQVQLVAFGIGGSGALAGNGNGGAAGVLGSLGGALTVERLRATTSGIGGFGTVGAGGSGTGGESLIQLQGIDLLINTNAILEANGFGGASINGNGGTGTGGTAYVGVTADTTGSGTITGETTIEANGYGGSPGTGGIGGGGFGGRAYAEAQAGSIVRFGSLQVTASGLGGENEDLSLLYVGGNGQGGTAELRSVGTGSQLIIERNARLGFATRENGGAILAALGFGGQTTGGSGFGGTGAGGEIVIRAAQGGRIALPANPTGDPDSVGNIRLTASGFGGGTTVAGGTGGFGLGGGGTIEADGGTIIIGEATFAVFGQGGSSLESTANITGGNAVGGRRLIRVLGGGEATLALSNAASGAEGGAGSGTGNGGSAFGGSTRVELNGGTLNVIGNLDLNELVRGGEGVRGGDALGNGEGGLVSFVATDSTITVAPNASGLAGISLGGTYTGGNGTTTGGNAAAGLVNFTLTSADISGGFLRITPRAEGGNVLGTVGQGGSATGGIVNVGIFTSDLNLVDQNLITANAEGGDGGSDSGSTGGSATSGQVTVALEESGITILPVSGLTSSLTVQSLAVGGDGAQAGNASADLARLQLVDSTIAVDQLLVEAAASALASKTGTLGGAAGAGTAEVDISGSSLIDVTSLAVDANAATSQGGATQGGIASISLAVDSGAQINADTLLLIADGVGSNLPTGNAAGVFRLAARGGNINVGELFASARGNTIAVETPDSLLIADGGNINVTGTLTGQLLGNLVIETGQGSIIGSPVNTTTTTSIAITSQAVIEIIGDNNAAIGLGGNSIALSARELDILPGARIGANAVTITSLDTVNTAVLGGINEGSGFSLTGDEVGRISARNLTITLPEVLGSNDPNLPDVLIRDLTFSGTQNEGFSAVRIAVGDLTNGIARLEGALAYIDAGITDLLAITAGERIEIVTPGSIRISNNIGAPGGQLALQSGYIWAADLATITQLQSDPNFGGRNALLAVAAAGSDDPLGYIRARDVDIALSRGLLVRNTGTATEQGGVLVGDGGLSIIGFNPAVNTSANNGAPLDVFAYGRRLRPDGTFVTGQAFFNEVNFNRTGQDPTTYSATSAFNDCVINTGECPQAPPPPPPSPPPSDRGPLEQINNPEVFERPVSVGDTSPAVEDEDEERYGVDFPDRPETPLITEDPLLDDPVTSGGDASLYGGTATPPSPPSQGGK